MDDKAVNFVQEEPKEDLLGKRKSLYDAGPFEIFWRNFLAGMSRTLGSLFLYLVFMIIVYGLFLKYVLPVYLPVINRISNLIESIEKMQKFLPQTSTPQDIPFSIFPKNK